MDTCAVKSLPRLIFFNGGEIVAETDGITTMVAVTDKLDALFLSATVGLRTLFFSRESAQDERRTPLATSREHGKKRALAQLRMLLEC